MHFAYDGSAVYIKLESIYRERACGLCGSFDYNQDNGLSLPNGKLTCNTNGFSKAYLQLNLSSPSQQEKQQLLLVLLQPKRVVSHQDQFLKR